MEAKTRKRQLLQRYGRSDSEGGGPITLQTNAYRLHFSCEHIGKYRSHTKRRITWRFGLTNLQAAREGRQGTDCRGEEHEVVLVWSVKSGKTRAFWNKINITHMFRDHQRNTEQVNICWKSRSGKSFEILAHEASNRFARQYDFLLDGVSIFSFPHVSELDPSILVNRMLPGESHSVSTTEVRSETDTHSGRSVECDTSVDAGFRLSMVGLTTPTSELARSCEPVDDLMDDLPSTPFTNVLESLRRRITCLIPKSNDMVSRAIVKALSDDVCESSSCSSSLGSSSLDNMALSATSIAAQAIWETTEWTNPNVEYCSRSDVMERKREFLQRQMDTLFMHAHNERLSEDAVAVILSDVATLLGVTIRTTVPKKTLILKGLDKTTDSESLLVSLMVFGEIQQTGVANGQGFAICRFASERGPLRVLSASQQGLLLINGKRPNVSLLEKPMEALRPSLAQRVESPAVMSTYPIPKPSFARRRSHQRNTIHIDTLISETPFLSLVNDPAIVSPNEALHYVRLNHLDKVPDHVHCKLATVGCEEPKLIDVSPYWRHCESPPLAMEY